MKGRFQNKGLGLQFAHITAGIRQTFFKILDRGAEKYDGNIYDLL